MTTIRIHLDLTFEDTDRHTAVGAAVVFGEQLANSHDVASRTLCLVDDGKPSVQRVTFVGAQIPLPLDVKL